MAPEMPISTETLAVRVALSMVAVPPLLILKESGAEAPTVAPLSTVNVAPSPIEMAPPTVSVPPNVTLREWPVTATLAATALPVMRGLTGAAIKPMLTLSLAVGTPMPVQFEGLDQSLLSLPSHLLSDCASAGAADNKTAAAAQPSSAARRHRA
ncbi:MAG: hypothetical protein K2Y27_29455 [Xanthobacteraceae bacterium]|nr:hypothetical protein [Xanthobacteraceae bacterium]